MTATEGQTLRDAIDVLKLREPDPGPALLMHQLRIHRLEGALAQLVDHQVTPIPSCIALARHIIEEET